MEEVVIEVVRRIKVLMDMNLTSIYDEKLKILVEAEMINIKNQVPIPNLNDLWFNNYVIVILPEVIKNLPIEIDFNKYNSLRVTKLNELRLNKPWLQEVINA